MVYNFRASINITCIAKHFKFAEYSAPKLGIAEESFNSTSVAVILDLIPPIPDVQPYDVLVTVLPTVSLVYNHSQAEMTLSFNVRYNVSFISMFCGMNCESDTLQLLYGECFS